MKPRRTLKFRNNSQTARFLSHSLAICILLALAFPALSASSKASAQQPTLHVLAFYSTNVEHDHVVFAEQALHFFTAAGARDHFDFQSTTHWDDLNPSRLKSVQIVVWLNDFPQTAPQRTAFEQYMRGGGRWLGFHIAAYNDHDTHWPWFVDFLGGGVFYGNNWPPLPAILDVDDTTSPITRHLPARFTSPANEWYIWQPSPRLNKNVKVLITLDPSNYPLGFKDTLTAGDIPVVWTNTKYRMIYLNMGHGDKIFTDPRQNLMFEDALLWLADHK
jgi:type 1 glutamine amidotransferase